VLLLVLDNLLLLLINGFAHPGLNLEDVSEARELQVLRIDLGLEGGEQVLNVGL
jgi:hypothetical protein